jgi:hypothetical protein
LRSSDQEACCEDSNNQYLLYGLLQKEEATVKMTSYRQSSPIIFLAIFLMALTSTIHPSALAYRCRKCPDLKPPEALGVARAVFIGKAISGEEIEWKDRNSREKWIELVGKVRFTVEQSFKSVDGNEIEAFAGDRECGFGPYLKGERYLLYLDRDYGAGLGRPFAADQRIFLARAKTGSSFPP